VIIVAGKGGVGKTTVAATAAHAFARAGQSVLLVSTDGRGDVGRLFNTGHLDYQESLLWSDASTKIMGRSLTSDEALVDYLLHKGLGRLAKRFAASGAIDLIATTTPGIKDLLILGKLRQLSTDRAADVIILDAPAAGHAITFLLSARGLAEVAGSGTVQHQAELALDLLTDEETCQVLLVTLAEETPVSELVDTAFHLEDRVGVSLMGVVVNQVMQSTRADLSDPGGLLASRNVAVSNDSVAVLEGLVTHHNKATAAQQTQLARLATELPLPRATLPAIPRALLSPDDIASLATSDLERLLGLGR
jgi:Mrp family chromosome partitioning ATPase